MGRTLALTATIRCCTLSRQERWLPKRPAERYDIVRTFVSDADEPADKDRAPGMAVQGLPIRHLSATANRVFLGWLA